MHIMDCSLNQDKNEKKKSIEFRWLDPQKLKPNPWNPNRMSPEMAGKLKAEIRNSGMILPIVVRPMQSKGGQSRGIRGTPPHQECPPHPAERGTFQIIDGEHRWMIAKELGMSSVPCIVVEMDENEARIITIQLNRLRGEDEPELLARLLRELEIDLGLNEITSRLPFDQVEIEQTLELIDLQTSEEARKKLDQEMSEMLKDRIFSVIVSEAEKATIEHAIHLFNSRSGTELRPGSALAKICEKYSDK